MEYRGGFAYDTCPNCGKEAEAEGVHNGIGYVYPPLVCPHCGWTERCALWETERCSNICTHYGYCEKLATEGKEKD